MTETQTFKQWVKENPDVLQSELYKYPNYNWGIIDVGLVNISSVTEVYDLTANRFYNKQPLPFEHLGGSPEGHYIFKPMNNTHAQDVNLASFFYDLEHRKDVLVFLVEYPNIYHRKNQLLIICDKNYYESMNNQDREIYITMNAYINLVHKKGRSYCIPSFENYEETFPFTKMFHWVWFRKDNYKLKNRQLKCVASWVELNPELEFNLWTDIEDENELRDFLSDLPETDTKFFFDGRIKINYLGRITEFLNMYFEKYGKDKSIRLFDKEKFKKIIEERDNSHIMIAKTDFLRAMLLHEYGGFYADFNDCQCIIPLRYWMKELYKGQELIWPCDTFNPKQISNYFVYVPCKSKQFEKFHYNTLEGFKGLWTLMKVEETKSKIAKLYLDMAKKYLKKIKTTETQQPVKLLVETMLPIFNSGKYLTELEDIMGKPSLKGLDYCDSRAKVHTPVHCLKYLGEKKSLKELSTFYKYMNAELMQVSVIRLKRNFEFNKDGGLKPSVKKDTPGDRYEIVYSNTGYQEDNDDIEDDVLPFIDEWIEGLNELYNDKDFQLYIYNRFIRNMNICVIALTNLILQNDCELTVNDVIPFSFAYFSFCYLTLLVHWGEGTSIGE